MSRKYDSRPTPGLIGSSDRTGLDLDTVRAERLGERVEKGFDVTVRTEGAPGGAVERTGAGAGSATVAMIGRSPRSPA